MADHAVGKAQGRSGLRRRAGGRPAPCPESRPHHWACAGSGDKYRSLLHGEAVAWGMIAATNIALGVGRTDSVVAGRIADAVLSLGRLPEVNVSSRKILSRLP